MLKLKKIAVTGGLSSGKTTICKLLKEKGAYVASGDEIVHQLLSPQDLYRSEICQKLIHLLGIDVVANGPNGYYLDKNKIAEKAFSQPALLKALEELIHPIVFDEIDKKYNQALQQCQYPLFVVEIPLLYEINAQSRFDQVIAVVASQEHCHQRFLSRGGTSEDFDKRMKRQMDPTIKARKADFIIYNDGNLEELTHQVCNLYSQLTQNT